MKKIWFILLAVLTVCVAASGKKNKMKEPIYALTEKGRGEQVGYIEVKKKRNGISIHVVASGLVPGSYGFHMHEKNSMTNTTDEDGKVVVGGGLGGHWDPDHTGRHAGPHGEGHRGDLEMLTIGEDGRINRTIHTTRIPFEAVKGKAFVIHAMPDNYTDVPANGGSGARAYASAF